MPQDKSASTHHHSASDRALDRSATESAPETAGPGHDPAEIAKHDDPGKDRLFEGRQQHDEAGLLAVLLRLARDDDVAREAEKNSEKTRLARDVGKHGHDTDDDVADAGSGPSAKRKG
jgi:hypothetical protein